MSDKDGGPAFPGKRWEENFTKEISYQGMTLRDYFAASTLTGFMSQDDNRTPQTYYEKEDINAWRKKIHKLDSEYCYAMADAMIEARKK